MRRAIAWLRWFWAGPDDTFKRETLGGFVDVGRTLFEFEKRLGRLEALAMPIAAHAPRSNMREANPPPIETRNWSEFQRHMENGAAK